MLRLLCIAIAIAQPYGGAAAPVAAGNVYGGAAAPAPAQTGYTGRAAPAGGEAAPENVNAGALRAAAGPLTNGAFFFTGSVTFFRVAEADTCVAARQATRLDISSPNDKTRVLNLRSFVTGTGWTTEQLTLSLGTPAAKQGQAVSSKGTSGFFFIEGDTTIYYAQANNLVVVLRMNRAGISGYATTLGSSPANNFELANIQLTGVTEEGFKQATESQGPLVEGMLGRLFA